MLLDKNDSLAESKKQITIHSKNSKSREKELREKAGKVSIDNLHNEEDDSHEIKFQKKIIRCWNLLF